MAIRLGKGTRGLVLAAICAALLAWAASVSTPHAAASACDRFGKTAPVSLKAEDARRAIVCLLNERRERAGLPKLHSDSKLDRAAQHHNRRMDGTGCFDHSCSGESDLSRRLERVGYLGGGLLRWAYGENIAWGLSGRGTPRAIVDAGWLRPRHPRRRARPGRHLHHGLRPPRRLTNVESRVHGLARVL